MKKNIISLVLIAIVSMFAIIQVQASTPFNIRIITDGRTELVTASDSGLSYANGKNIVRVEWDWLSGYNQADITISGLGGISETRLKVNISTAFVEFSASEIDGLPTGNYAVQVTQKGSNVSDITGYIGSLTVDKTAPTIAGSLEIMSGTTVVTSTRNNSTIIKLEFSEMVDSNKGDYLIEYALGTSSTLTYTAVPSAAITTTISGGKVTEEITLRANGLNIADNTVNFRVRARDLAGNISANSLTANFILDTVAPGPVINLVMRDGTFIVEQNALRKGVTQLTWTAPAGVTDIAGYNVYIREGSNQSFVKNNNDLVTTTSYNVNTTSLDNGLISFRVVAVDQAGNALLVTDSSVPTATFNLFKRDIEFDIQYFASVSSGYITVSGVAGINAIQRETLRVVDNDPLIARYVISTQDISNDSYTYIVGTKAELQAALRALTGSPAGGYFVVVQDEAGNSSKIRLNLDQVGPTLPANQSLTITSKDQNNQVGVQSRVTIAFTAATGATTYRVFINGEEVAVATSGAGQVQVDISTIEFGDVENLYELRAYNAIGNFSVYNTRVHVTEDLVKPYAKVISTSSREDSISFTAELTDPRNLLTQSNAVLYLNNVEVSRQVLLPGVQTYTFTGLDPNRLNYQIRLQGAFRFDGTPFPAGTVLNSETVYNIETLRTIPDIQATINSADVEFNSISLSITSTKRTTASFNYQVRIYDSGVLVATTPTAVTVTNDTANLTRTDTVFLGGFTEGKLYQVRVTDANRVIATYNFYPTKTIPTATVSAATILDNSLSLNITVNDPDNAITTSQKAIVRVFENNQLLQSFDINSLGTTTIDVTNLLPDRAYDIRVYASHRIANEFNILNDILVDQTFRTAKQPPTAFITWSEFFDVTSSSITFDLNLEDPFTTLSAARVQLYTGGTKVGDPIEVNRGRFSNLIFSGLQSNTEYFIVVEAQYDLNDGRGVIVKNDFLQGFVNTFYRSPSFRTPKAIPVAEIVSSGATNTSLNVRVSLTDIDQAFVEGSIRIFAPNQTSPIVTRALFVRSESFIFDNLSPDVEYEVVVEVNYDILDGRGLRLRQRILDVKLKTQPNVGASITSSTTSSSTATTIIDLVNYDDVPVIAQLQQNGINIGSPVLLEVGSRTITFDNLNPSTIYTVLVLTQESTPVELSRLSVQTAAPVTLRTPTVSLSRVVAEGSTIRFSAVVVDNDNTLLGPLTVEICSVDTPEQCQTLIRTVDELSTGLVVDLEEGEYTVSVSADYDIATSLGVATSNIQAISISDIVEPEPEPEPEPVQPVEPAPSPREPLDLNLGVILGSVLGAVALGFTGVFFYSFRRFYVR